MKKRGQISGEYEMLRVVERVEIHVFEPRPEELLEGSDILR